MPQAPQCLTLMRAARKPHHVEVGFEDPWICECVSRRGTRVPAFRSKHRQVELFLAGDLAEFVLSTGFDLTDALLGDTQLAAELFQRLLAGAPQAEAADDDLAARGRPGGRACL